MSIFNDIPNTYNTYIINKSSNKNIITINEYTNNDNNDNDDNNDNNDINNIHLNLDQITLHEIPFNEHIYGPPYISYNNMIIEYYQTTYGLECKLYIQNKENLNLKLENIKKISSYILDNNILLKGFNTYLNKEVYILIK